MEKPNENEHSGSGGCTSAPSGLRGVRTCALSLPCGLLDHRDWQSLSGQRHAGYSDHKADHSGRGRKPGHAASSDAQYRSAEYATRSCNGRTTRGFAVLAIQCWHSRRHGSTLLRFLNVGSFDLAADQFRLWNHATVDGRLVVLAGLTRRRAIERDVFLGRLSALAEAEV